VPAHAELNHASGSSIDQGHLAQYGCDGTHKEAGHGHQVTSSRLVEPGSLSPPHPVLLLPAASGSHPVICFLIQRWTPGCHLLQISIGLIPALKQTILALCHELQVANTYRVSSSLWAPGNLWVNVGHNSSHHPYG
jgi:hypothetical protein